MVDIRRVRQMNLLFNKIGNHGAVATDRDDYNTDCIGAVLPCAQCEKLSAEYIGESRIGCRVGAYIRGENELTALGKKELGGIRSV